MRCRAMRLRMGLGSRFRRGYRVVDIGHLYLDTANPNPGNGPWSLGSMRKFAQ
jgi:hypothetical protein